MMNMNTELNSIDKEKYSQNLQRKKAYYYKKDGNTVAYGYQKICPLDIITGNSNHKGFYIQIHDGELYRIWTEMEGVIFCFCTCSKWDTLENLSKNLKHTGKEEFLRELEAAEEMHGYIKQLHIMVVKALGYGGLAEHYTEYMSMIRQEQETERHKRKLKEKRKLDAEEKRRQSEFGSQLFNAENSILKKEKVKNVKTNKGSSLFLELFKANGIRLPLRTQGWVNDILAEVAFKFDGSITYCYYSRGSDSRVFRDYLHKLEQKILEKQSICSNQNEGM